MNKSSDVGLTCFILRIQSLYVLLLFHDLLFLLLFLTSSLSWCISRLFIAIAASRASSESAILSFCFAFCSSVARSFSLAESIINSSSYFYLLALRSSLIAACCNIRSFSASSSFFNFRPLSSLYAFRFWSASLLVFAFFHNIVLLYHLEILLDFASLCCSFTASVISSIFSLIFWRNALALFLWVSASALTLPSMHLKAFACLFKFLLRCVLSTRVRAA